MGPFIFFNLRIMKPVLSSQVIDIPKDVTVTFKSRKVTVTGPRGTLYREFKHLNLSMVRLSAKKIRVDVWFGKRKNVACVRTICSHIENMIKGVRLGYQYTMRLVFAHFPISVNHEGGKALEIRNFLGEEIQRNVAMDEGVTIRGGELKGELILEGNDIEKVSRSAALIQQSCLVRNKDIRKFLDGIYVEHRRTVVTEDD